MIRSESIPPHHEQSPGDLIRAVWQAQQAGDEGALFRRLGRMSLLLRKLSWLWPAAGRIGDLELEDRIQEFLARITRVTERGEVLPEQPGAFGKAVARNLTVDAWRQAIQAQALEDDGTRHELDESGVFSLRDLQAADLVEEQTRQLAERMRGYVSEYRSRSRALRGQAELQIRAWWLLRVCGQPARDVAAALGVGRRAGGGVSSVQQWAKRGAEKVLRLSEQDEDLERAAAMRRAAAFA